MLHEPRSSCEQAAKDGQADAALQLGHLYRSKRNFDATADAESNAIIWYMRAAEAGNVEAQFTLGTMYLAGSDIEKDAAAAASWLEKAAENDHAQSQFQLAVLYCTGQGVPLDLSQALIWYERAANLGHRFAQYNLGVMLAKGQGCEPDQDRAVAFLRQAAEQGVAEAQRALGGADQTGSNKSANGDAA